MSEEQQLRGQIVRLNDDNETWRKRFIHSQNENTTLRTENEQLRALVSDCENRIYCDSRRMEYDSFEESDKADAELRDIQQRAKALGIEVNE